MNNTTANLVFFSTLPLTDSVLSINGFAPSQQLTVAQLPSVLDNFCLDGTGDFLMTVETNPGSMSIMTNSGTYNATVASAANNWWNTVILSSHPIHAPK